jgi:hypothetical protein
MLLVRRIFLIASLLLVHSGVFAETLASPAEAKQLADQVMAKVAAGEMEAGVRLTKSFTIIPAAEFDAVLERLKLQLPVISQRFGKSIGTEFVREEKVGENLFRLTYMHRFENHPMRWVFYFYRGKSGWVMNTFWTDDNIRQLFLE